MTTDYHNGPKMQSAADRYDHDNDRRKEDPMSLSFSAIRLAALDKAPYLGVAMWNIVPVEKPGLGTFACDEWWRVYWDPDKAVEWGVKESAAVLIHEIWHLLRSHAKRGKNANPMAWNIAGDCEINDDLLHEGLPLPGDCVTPRSINAKENLTAEEYYAKIMRDAKDHGSGCQCGSGAGGEPVPGELGPPQKSPDGSGDGSGQPDPDIGSDGEGRQEAASAAPANPGGMSETEAEVIRQQVATSVKNAGTTPDHVSRWANKQLEPPKADPRAILKAAIRRAVDHVAGRVDYTWKRSSRRFRSDVVLPGMIKPVPRVSFVIDTSGSISEDDLAQEISFIDRALRQCGIKDAHVVVCDAAIHQARKIMKATQINPTGGGGTDMRKGIKKALEARPDVVVVLTDGYTPWPRKAPRAKVIVALVGDWVDSDSVPNWARTIRLNEEG